MFVALCVSCMHSVKDGEQPQRDSRDAEGMLSSEEAKKRCANDLHLSPPLSIPAQVT